MKREEGSDDQEDSQDEVGELQSAMPLPFSPSQHSRLDPCRDRVQGLLLGLAAGDENGGPIEMAILLAESLLTCKRYDPVDVGNRYLRWYRDPANYEVIWDTGPNAADVFDRCSQGSDLPAASKRVHVQRGGQTAGANSLHRVAPIAAAAFVGDSDLARLGSEESGLTHHHELARSCCSAFLVLCRSLLHGRSFTEGLQAAARMPDLEAPVVQLLLSAAELLHLEEDKLRQRRKALSAGGFCIHTFAAGLHFAVLADVPEEALRQAKVFAGRDNYCPVVTGALLGARFGGSSLKPLLRTTSHSPVTYRKFMVRATHVASLLADGWMDAGRSDSSVQVEPGSLKRRHHS
mmetsp:Transcript_45389/g.97304  ORF Transcript_45389/g.97304 Transcript_45389/m.97304 type:complete len:348 (-) Transcript_45389:287-1330(-)